MVHTRTPLTVALVSLLVFSACDREPTAPALTPGDAELARLSDARAPADFEYEVIRVPGALAATGTLVQRANTRGDLVGRYMGPEGVRGFLLRKNGAFETLHVEGSVVTVAFGINERGTVVGTHMSPDGTFHGFTYEDGVYDTFDAPAGVNFGQDTWIWDVSTMGALAGGFTDDDGIFKAFVYDRGEFTRIMYPGSLWTEAFGINVRGEVTGHFRYPESPQMFGFVWKDGEFTALLDYPGEDDWMSCSMGIGVHGETVGHVAGTFPDGIYGYLWSGGEFTALLMVPGASQTYPTAVAPNGRIAGYAIMPDGERVGFVAHPK